MTMSATSKVDGITETEQEEEDRLEAAFKRLQAIMSGDEEECQNETNRLSGTTPTQTSVLFAA